ncbi:hypothetical protein JCM19037_395 [Geomicrobium sp. JCM 19037]|nr:hypothetical protein JCM19037_395 [Geomicrobium sp. JCM 19037]
MSFEERMMNEEEEKEWMAAMQLGERGREEIKNDTVSNYLQKLKHVREETCNFLKQQEDEWLYKERQFPDGTPYNNYFLWFHVLEDEISHRGQIKLIKRHLEANA